MSNNTANVTGLIEEGLKYIVNIDEKGISIISLLFTIITTIFIIYLTILTLKISAPPKLKILLKNNGEFYPGEEIILTYHLQNVGRHILGIPLSVFRYGTTAAKDVLLFINFDPSFEPLEIRYGSNLEERNRNVFRGKKNSKYMMAKKIHLTYSEPGENVEMKVKMPDTEGNYSSWIAAFSEKDDCGVHKFKIIVKNKKEIRNISNEIDSSLEETNSVISSSSNSTPDYVLLEE